MLPGSFAMLISSGAVRCDTGASIRSTPRFRHVATDSKTKRRNTGNVPKRVHIWFSNRSLRNFTEPLNWGKRSQRSENFGRVWALWGRSFLSFLLQGRGTVRACFRTFKASLFEDKYTLCPAFSVTRSNSPGNESCANVPIFMLDPQLQAHKGGFL